MSAVKKKGVLHAFTGRIAEARAATDRAMQDPDKTTDNLTDKEGCKKGGNVPDKTGGLSTGYENYQENYQENYHPSSQGRYQGDSQENYQGGYQLNYQGKEAPARTKSDDVSGPETIASETGRSRLPRTENEKRLWRFLEEKNIGFTQVPALSRSLGIRVETLRKIFQRWDKYGLIRRKHVVCDGVPGLFIERLIDSKNYQDFYQGFYQENYQSPGYENYQGEIPLRKTDRDSKETKNLSVYERLLKITDEDVSLDFPGLFSIGFVSSQFRQIAERLEKKGALQETIFDALRWANWEAENGGIRVKDGSLADTPRDYVFVSLAREGCYRRPVGYKTPQEIMLEDLKAEKEAREQAETQLREIAFSEWDAALAPEEKARIEGLHPGPKGPEIMQRSKRRSYWEKHVFGNHAPARGEKESL